MPGRIRHLLLAGALGALSWAAVGAPPEHEVRAAIVANLVFFSEWPDRPPADAVLPICVAGRGATATALLALNGKMLNGRPVSTHSLQTPGEGRNCRILFISDSNARGPAEWLSEFSERPVLTVAESEDFLAMGGILSLQRSNNRVVFDVSLPAMRRAGLRIGSQLLRLAREVHGK